jgi:hypothetical protein
MADDQAPRDPDYDGLFTSISLDPNLYSLAGGVDAEGGELKTMSARDMRAFVADQLWAMMQASTTSAITGTERNEVRDNIASIAAEIVAWMPERAMYRRVIENLDLRPFVDAWGRQPAADGESMVRNQMATILLDGAQQQIVAAYRDTNANNTVAGQASQDQVLAAANAQAFNPSTAGLSPAVTVREADQQIDSAVLGGEITVDQANEALYADDPLGDLDDPAATITFPMEDFRRALRIGTVSNIEQLANQEADWVQQQLDAGAAVDPSTAFVPIDLGMRPTTNAAVPGETRPQQVVLNAVDAMDYLSKMTPSEIASLQRSLARAGYMANDQGLVFEEGDQFDPLTHAAWQRALYDSAREQTPLPKLLVDRSAKEDQRRAQAARINDEEAFRVGVNAIVRDILGRDLAYDEFQEVRNSITNIAARRAMQVPGMDARQNWEGTTYDNELYGESDVSAAIQQEVGAEMRAAASWDAGQGLYQIIGRDFPGTQREE